MNREELMVLEKEQLVEIIMALTEQVEKLVSRVLELEGRLNTNSGNSGKPPSSDGPGGPVPKSQRERSGKRAGGQRGHAGSGLILAREPDETEDHAAMACAKCGAVLSGMSCECVKTSNVIDIEVEVKIVKHRQMATACPACGHMNLGEMPTEANHSMVYGAGLRSLVVLLSNYACVGMKKISELLGDVFGVPISAGTIANMNAGFAEQSAPLVAEIKERAHKSGVPDVDESSMSMNGTNWWLHTSSTSELTHMTAHEKRGKEGIDANGVLPDYVGVVVHDFWSPYFAYGEAEHAMCCAHLLRELKWVTENTPQTWAAAMSDLLVKMKLTKQDYMSTDHSELSPYYAVKFAQDYASIVVLGERQAPRDPGRKQSKARNLLERFIEYKHQITLFAYDFNVPFSNNLAERDIRNAKVKNKVSGAFRSHRGIHAFAAISSVIGTAKKQGLAVFDSLKSILSGFPSSLFVDNLYPTE